MKSFNKDYSKDELEKLKLHLEINKLKQPVFIQPSFLVPIIVAILGFLAAYLSGWFDQERRILEKEKSILEKDANKYAGIKKSLQKDTSELRIKIKNYNHQLEKEKFNYSTLLDSNNFLKITLERGEKKLKQLNTDYNKVEEDIHILSHNRQVLQNDIDYYYNYWKSIDPPGVIIEDYLSKVPPNYTTLDILKQLQETKKYKSAMWGAWDENIGLFSNLIKENLFIIASDFRITYMLTDLIHWSFIGKFQNQENLTTIFVLLWARTPMVAIETLKNLDLSNILKDGTIVKVESPFSTFHSARVSQDEDLLAICTLIKNGSQEKTLQEILIEKGLAVYYRGEFNAPWILHEKLIQAQEKAKHDKSGLWATYPVEMNEVASQQPREN